MSKIQILSFLITTLSSMAFSQPTVTPNDGYYYWQTYLNIIEAPQAWYVTTGSSSTVIGVVDTGVYNGLDLQSNLLPGWNFADNNANTNDVAPNVPGWPGHGTVAAGIIAADTNNGGGVAGICWTCKMLPIRVSDNSGNAPDANIAAGINWGVSHGAKIIVLGFPVTDSATVTAAAQSAFNQGVLVIAPAGDNGTRTGNYAPTTQVAGSFDSSANNPYILTVSALNPNGTIWFTSNTGNNVDIAAPSNVVTTLSNGRFDQNLDGTAASAAVVAGVAGLVRSANPTLTAADVRDILLQSADQKSGAQGTSNTTYGYGAVNAYKAVTMASGGGSKGTSTTTLSASGIAVSAGQSVTLSALVSATATGSVTLYNGGAALGTLTLASGKATFTTTSLPGGSNSLTAGYAGDNNNESSISTAVTVTVSAAKSASATSVNSTLNPSIASQSVNFSAAVSPATATGTVTFKDGSTTLGSANLSSGTASFSANLAAGSHSITASYSGDNNTNASSSNAMIQMVNAVVTKSATSVTVASSVNPSTAGQAVSFTATVTPSTATGTVTFLANSATLGTAAISGGKAMLSTSSLAAGSYSITASYSGDNNTNSSASSALPQTVNPVKTQTVTVNSFVATPSGITQGQTSTLAWSVTGATAVSISGIGTVAGSSVSVSPSQTTTYILTASNGSVSTSSQVTVTVSAAVATGVAITSAPASASLGQTITIRGTGFVASDILWINSPGIGLHGLRVSSSDGATITFTAGTAQEFAYGVNTLYVTNASGQSNTVSISLN